MKALHSLWLSSPDMSTWSPQKSGCGGKSGAKAVVKEKKAGEEEESQSEKTAGELFGEAANFHKPGKNLLPDSPQTKTSKLLAFISLHLCFLQWYSMRGSLHVIALHHCSHF